MSAPEQPRDIIALTKAFRDAVSARESVATAQLIVAYQTLYDALEEELDGLLAFVSARREAGVDINPAWLRRQGRLAALVGQVEREVGRIAGNADTLITNGQRDLVALGQVHAEQLTLASMGTPPPGVSLSFNRLNAGAVETMVGFLRPGTPLREALDRLPDMASQDVRDALVRGIGTGQHPRVVAEGMRLALGGNVASVEKLARTTMLNSYRESTLATYRENADIVTGWRWVAELGPLTCLSCLSKHGQSFPLEESFRDHWNGRCAAVAITRSYSDILGIEGIPDTRPVIETGEAWFNRQSLATQREAMGRSKYHAYKNGEFQFKDLSVSRNDPVFGLMFEEATLVQLLGIKRAKYWYMQSAAIERGEFDDLPLAEDD